jgi:hypothetical protein
LVSDDAASHARNFSVGDHYWGLLLLGAIGPAPTLKDFDMNKTFLTAVLLACSMTSVLAGTDPYLEYNCAGLPAPSNEASVVSAVAAKPALTSVAKRNKSSGASGIARSTVTGGVGTVAQAEKTTRR